MRVLFFMRNFGGYFRQFEPAVRELLRRGHVVHIDRDRTRDDEHGERWARDIADEYPALTWGKSPATRTDPWYDLRRNVRLTRDFVHFLRPQYAQTEALVRRARDRAPESVVRLASRNPGPLSGPRRVEGALACLRAVEAAMPPSPALLDHIAKRHPDVVLLTPHLMPGSHLQEYLRAAMALGIPSALCVASWDNLSSKQVIRVAPDLVTVWNDVQRREAIDLHGLPPARIAVTGAQVYDHWFDWPARPRTEFCERVGLPPNLPFVLYAAGALFPAEITEAQWAVRWLRSLRASDDPRLRDLAILVRPHPKRFIEWSEVNLEGLGPLTVWPQEGRMPVDAEAKADFYDSIAHSAGVVGVNTSAMIEAAIIGRRVHTVLVPEFTGSQHGTLHFRYLTEIGGGLLRVAEDLDQHLGQLADSVANDGRDDGLNRAFLEAFVRPHGLYVPAAPVFADRIDELAGRPTVGLRPSPLDRALRIALEPVRLGFASHGRGQARAKTLRRKRQRG